jgi:glutamate dehydrogenase
MTRWLLNRPGANLNIAAMVERYQAPMSELRQALPKVLPAESRADLQDDAAGWQGKGFPAELAREFAVLPFLTYALDIIDIALDLDVPVADVGQAYFMLSDALHSKWLMDNVEALPVDGRWHAQARGVLRDELQSQQRALVTAVLAGATGSVGDAVNEWLGRDDAALRYTLQMFTDMRNLRRLDYPTLSVAVRRLAHVVACAYGNN